MKSLKIHGKLDMRLAEDDLPEPGTNEVRIKVKYVGICGSDLHYYYEGANGAFVVQQELIPGHELSGIVDSDPSGEFTKGTRITVHPAGFGNKLPGLEKAKHLWPGGNYLGSASTMPHTQGAAAEFIILKKNMLRVVPEELSLEHAALAEPLAVGLHAINVAGGLVGKKVLISGSGPIGLLAIAAAKLLGAKSITASDVLEGPLARAREMGAGETIKIGAEQIPNEEFDLVLECSGSPQAISAAITACKRQGTIVQVGMLGAGNQPIQIAPLISKELHLHGTFRFNDEIDDAIIMLSKNAWIGKAITQIYPLQEAIKAFEMAKDSEKSGKVLISL
jgi:L-idonate 5-dehydrogenase